MSCAADCLTQTPSITGQHTDPELFAGAALLDATASSAPSTSVPDQQTPPHSSSIEPQTAALGPHQDSSTTPDAFSKPSTDSVPDSGAGETCSDSVVCPACLGVLQAPEGSLQAVPAGMLAGLPEAEGNAGSWQTCNSGSAQTLSQCVRYSLPAR